MYAFALPPMILTAVAPPPLKALLPPALRATVIDDAVDAASIVAASVAPTLTLPLVAVAWPTLLMNAVMSFLTSLRATLNPTDMDKADEVDAETDSDAAETTDSMAEVSFACMLMSPLAAVTAVAVST